MKIKTGQNTIKGRYNIMLKARFHSAIGDVNC